MSQNYPDPDTFLQSKPQRSKHDQTQNSPNQPHADGTQGSTSVLTTGADAQQQTCLNSDQSNPSPFSDGTIVTNSKEFNKDYVLLLDAIDYLKLSKDPDLPEIVVLGEQSEGKSTILEKISRCKLPKGNGLCTKCLIRLRIRQNNSVKDAVVTISVNGGFETAVKNPNDFSRELQERMDQECKNGISMNTVIDVKVSRPIQRRDHDKQSGATALAESQTNLTVIDVPGFTKDLLRDEASMTAIKARIQNPNVIMVVVLKAINDFEISTGYDLAKKLDPKSKRTVFVLTHCDNLSRNKHEKVEKMINSEGAFAVNCYPELEEYSREKEMEFFDGLFWQQFPRSRLGIQSLDDCLSQKMFNIMKPLRNELKEKLRTKWLEVKEEHQKALAEKNGFNREVKKLLHLASKAIEESVTGSGGREKNLLYSKCREQYAEFEKELHKVAETLRANLRDSVDEEYKDQRGRELISLEATFDILERIVDRKFIAKVEPKVDSLITKIERETTESIRRTLEASFGSHDSLRSFYDAKIKKYLLTLSGDLVKQMREIQAMEKVVYKSELDGQCGKPNSGHTSGTSKTSNQSADSYQAQLDDKQWEQQHKDTLYNECLEYINFLEYRLANTIPKAIRQFMFNRIGKDIYECFAEDIEEETRRQIMKGIEAKEKELKENLDKIETILTRF